MQNLEWYLADLKSTGKNTVETVEKSLTDMFIRLVRIYPCLLAVRTRQTVTRWHCSIRPYCFDARWMPRTTLGDCSSCRGT